MSDSIQISGTCDPRFEPVLDAFRANFVERGDVGASVSVTLAGAPVVDLWAGTCTTDAGPDQAWQADTIINVWSVTKTMSFLVILMLADRGLLDLDAPIADAWPEFAVNGKQSITTKHVLAHTAGLSGIDQPVADDETFDWELVCGRLEAMTPWWEPGSQSGYHAVTQGFLLGEIVRRVSGRTLGEFFAAEVAGPAGADFHIGTPAEHDHQVAHVIGPPSTGYPAVMKDSISYRTFMSFPPNAALSATVPWRRAEIGAAGGHGNGRSIARAMAILANHGTLDGHRYLSPEACESILDEQQHGMDLVLFSNIRYGLGFGLGNAERPLDNERCCYWNGWGGARALVDMENQISLGYAMNDMRHNLTGDARSETLLEAVYASLRG